LHPQGIIIAIKNAVKIMSFFIGLNYI
jgi:hypothetical protein